MKRGLILEGGGMRGMFTCGVTDVFLSEKIEFDGAVGVSAGACFGCNYKSRQKGRAIRYNMKYCNDKRYVSFGNWIKTGDVYGVDFCFRKVPFELDIWDYKAFEENPMEFHVVCTDAFTGDPVYHLCTDGLTEDVEYIRASSSMPVASNVVEIGEQRLMDGGVSDSIPVKYFQQQGYDRNIVVLTQPMEYRKKKSKMLPLIKLKHRRYPGLYKAMSERHLKYNETLDYITELEKLNEILVIRPPQSLNIPNLCQDPAQLKRVYDMGVETGKAYLDQVKQFLGGSLAD